MRKSIKKIIGAVSASVMALALTVGVVPTSVNAAATKDAQKIGKQELVTTEGSVDYHAYIWFQCQESWVYRNQWWGDDGTGIDSDIFNQVVSSLQVTDPFAVDGTIQDAEIKGDGTYTVSITGLNGAAKTPGGKTPANEPIFSLLGISTDMPVNEQIQISDIKIKIDGIESGTVENPMMDEDTKADPGTVTWDLINAYHEDYPQLSGALVPNDSVEVSFKISGFGFDNPDAVEQTEAPQKDDDANAGDSADSASADSDDTNSDNGISGGMVAGIVIVVIIVIAAIVVVVKRKKD